VRAVAEYAIRGKRQAVIVAVVAALVPMLFWLSAATIVLTTLRKGVAEGLNLMLWAGLPAMFWLVMGADPTPIIVIVGAMILAVVLRATVSWVQTLLVGVVLGLLISLLMPLMVPELLTPEVLSKLAPKLEVDSEQSAAVIGSLLTGFWAAAHLLVILLSLMLGRWWQSLLFNPGGFGEEFKQLLLPPVVAVPAILIAQFGGNFHPAFVGWAPVLMMPLFIAAIALVHGVVGIKKLGFPWLVLMYLLVFLVGPYIALVDSLMNFRRRIQRAAE
jgi:hypothetical protein